jgi:hypothetical protein
MKKLFLCALIAASALSLKAQNCDLYIPFEEGTVLSYTDYNAKGKSIGEQRQTLVSRTEEAGATVFVMRQENPLDKKAKPVDMTFRCEGDRFIIDMNSFVDPKTQDSYKDVKVDMTAESIDIPFGATPGTKLKDGNVILKVVSDSPINMATKVFITNRKVEAIESVTTEAGTFECLKISQTVTTDMGFMKMTINTIDWVAKNVGSVKSETYNKQNKLMGSRKLTGITK